nr:MAG TPA: YopX protein [Caudoviricetes sp.]
MVPKFRAFLIEAKTMHNILAIDFSRNMYCLQIGKATIGEWFWFREIELMQSTGLKDKNGEEIFEGDIVFDRWANGYTPVFQNGIYMAYNPKNLMQNDPSTQFNIIWKDGCEVIGNIYENPELLEQADEN